MCTSWTLSMLFLPFHGYANECFQLMNHLCKDSRALWNDSQTNYLKLLKKIATIGTIDTTKNRAENIYWEPKPLCDTSKKELLQIQLFKIRVILRSKEQFSNIMFFLSGDYHIEIIKLDVEFIDHETVEIYRKFIKKLGRKIADIEMDNSTWKNEDLLKEFGKPGSNKIPFDKYIDQDAIENGKVAGSTYYSGEACSEVFEYCLDKNIQVYEWEYEDSEARLVHIEQYLFMPELFSSVKRMVIDEQYIIDDHSLKILSNMVIVFPNIDDLRIKINDDIRYDRITRYIDLAVYTLTLSNHYPCSYGYTSLKTYCPVVSFKSESQRKLMKFKSLEAKVFCNSIDIRGSVLGAKRFNVLTFTGSQSLADSNKYDDEIEGFEDQSMIMNTKYIYHCLLQCYKNTEQSLFITFLKILQPYAKVRLDFIVTDYLAQNEWVLELVMNPPPLLHKLSFNCGFMPCDHTMELLCAIQFVNYQIPGKGDITVCTRKEYREYYEAKELARK